MQKPVCSELRCPASSFFLCSGRSYIGTAAHGVIWVKVLLLHRILKATLPVTRLLGPPFLTCSPGASVRGGCGPPRTGFLPWPVQCPHLPLLPWSCWSGPLPQGLGLSVHFGACSLLGSAPGRQLPWGGCLHTGPTPSPRPICLLSPGPLLDQPHLSPA